MVLDEAALWASMTEKIILDQLLQVTCTRYGYRKDNEHLYHAFVYLSVSITIQIWIYRQSPVKSPDIKTLE